MTSPIGVAICSSKALIRCARSIVSPQFTRRKKLVWPNNSPEELNPHFNSTHTPPGTILLCILWEGRRHKIQPSAYQFTHTTTQKVKKMGEWFTCKLQPEWSDHFKIYQSQDRVYLDGHRPYISFIYCGLTAKYLPQAPVYEHLGSSSWLGLGKLLKLGEVEHTCTLERTRHLQLWPHFLLALLLG